MYDTVCLVLPRPTFWEIPSTLSRVRESADKITGEITLKGSLRNMSVTTNANEISLFGSLPRYFHGSNAVTMTRAGTEEAIQNLSETLSLPLEVARVYRLDVAANILVMHPVADYLATLGPWRRTHKREYTNGNLSYQGGQSSLTFYDKVMDLKRNGHPLPEHWEGRNVLRIELQMKSKVKGQLGQAVSGKDLWSERIYMKAIDKWHGSYLTVEKIKLMEGMPMGGVKELRGYLEYIAIQTIGYDNLLQADRMARKLGNLTKEQAKERRRAFRKIAAYSKGEAKGLIEELDQKAATIVAGYR
jgi:hypothetical protein